MNYYEESLKLHEQNKGKIEVRFKGENSLQGGSKPCLYARSCRTLQTHS